MAWTRKLIMGLWSLFRKRQAEQDMDEELRGYIEAAAQERMRSGMSREEAVRTARAEMGNLEAVKEEIRRSGWEASFGTLLQDFHHRLRKKRQLAQRTEFPMKEVTMRKPRLVLSVTVIAAFLILAVGVGIWVSPLRASAETDYTPLLTSGPALRWGVPPVYPPALRAAGIEGNVTLRVTIERDGSVSRVENWAGNPQLAQAAIEALPHWRYWPREKAITTNVSIAFTTVKEPNWDFFDKDYVGPKLIDSRSSTLDEQSSAAKQDATMVLLAMIAANGRVTDVKAAAAIDQGLTESVVRAVKTWKYQPARKAGKPVPAFDMVWLSTGRSHRAASGGPDAEIQAGDSEDGQ